MSSYDSHAAFTHTKAKAYSHAHMCVCCCIVFSLCLLSCFRRIYHIDLSMVMDECYKDVLFMIFLLLIIAYQDCAVGLLFALLPVLGGTSGILQGVISMTKS